MNIYPIALEAWQHRLDLYESIANLKFGPPAPPKDSEPSFQFLYPPSFIPLYAPLGSLPAPWGDIVFRLIGCIGMGWMLGRLMRVQGRRWQPFDYALLSALTVPVSLGALQVGQANTLLACIVLVTCWGIRIRSPIMVGACLAVGIAVKPFMAAPAGLAVLVLPGCVMPLLLGLTTLICLPLLMAPAPYVTEQYISFVHHMTGPCLQVTMDRFADINGLLRGIGRPLTGEWSSGLRVAAGMLLAVWVFRSRSRWNSTDLALLWLGASVAYLMLFNPMTEANSYCMLSVPAALFAWRWIDAGRPAMGWAFAAALPLMGFGSEILRPIASHAAGSRFDLRFMPLTAIAFLLALIRFGLPRNARSAPDIVAEQRSRR